MIRKAHAIGFIITSISIIIFAAPDSQNDLGWVDSDLDGLNDNQDNCPIIFNPTQMDLNQNGIGDPCDPEEQDSFRIIAQGKSLATTTPSLLYFVDFETPPHIIGEPPVLGRGPIPRDKPTEIIFGMPLVFPFDSTLSNQSLLFGQTEFPDQIRFGIARDINLQPDIQERFLVYHFESDIFVEEPGFFSLTFFVDGPRAHHVLLSGGGVIIARVLGSEAERYTAVVGTLDFGNHFQLRITIDFEKGEWIIFTDGIQRFSGPYPIPVQFRNPMGGMRINFSGIAEKVTVDNIYIWGEFLSPDPQIDIMPDSDRNPIKIGGPGVVPVAILGSEFLNVHNVEKESLRFGFDDSLFHQSCPHFEDVNDDGFIDLVAHFDKRNYFGRKLECLYWFQTDTPWFQMACDRISPIP